MQVHGPFQMLNIIHFLVFRVTRTVLYSLECVLAGSPAKTVSQQSYLGCLACATASPCCC